jgi:hypothetical protein
MKGDIVIICMRCGITVPIEDRDTHACEVKV